MEQTRKLSYLSNVRSLVIFLVVVMHSNVTYSGMGGWYYIEGHADRLDLVSKLLFGLYGSFTQAWFMGILFFLSAFFATQSIQKRGPGAFARERLVRLGVPLLIYMFVISPIIGYGIMNYGNVQAYQSPVGAYWQYLTSGQWVGSTGPLWFVEALLIFSLLYALWRTIWKRKEKAPSRPGTLTLILVIVATSLLAFAIRLVQPIGTDVANLQLGFFGSYIVLFLLGLHAGERQWLLDYPEKTGLRWFWVSLGAGIPLWAILMVVGGALQSGIPPIGGGMHWQSLAYAFWESFVAIGFSIGLIAFFRKYGSADNAATKLVADNSFAVFMFHAPVLIGISLLLQDWLTYPLLKHVLVAPLAFVATLALSFLILRRIPGLRTVLK